jgi:CDP-diacylglycerol--glycerol-3-phosphate 3-phosphatidyltransferase/cardiolipin synthase
MISNAITSVRLVLAGPLLILVSLSGPGERWAALALLAIAGLSDVVDGRVARALGEVSRAGAMLDLIADRLLTLVLVAGLIASGELSGAFLIAGVVLMGRDLVVASFGEAAPGPAIRVTAIERVKIALQFAGLGLLVAPPLAPAQYDAGRWLLAASAALALATVALYARRAARALGRPSGREKKSAISPSAGVPS